MREIERATERKIRGGVLRVLRLRKVEQMEKGVFGKRRGGERELCFD